MSATDPFARAVLDRRNLLKAAGAGLGAAALGGVVGCSPGGGSGGSGPTIDPADRVELSEPLPEVLYPEPYIGPRAYDRKPFGDGEQTFRVVVPTDATAVGDWNSNDFSAWLEERTGVKIQYQAVNIAAPDGSQDLSKINAMLASGDLPDAFLGVGFTEAQIALYGQQGIFTDLTELVQAYAPIERQALDEIDTLKQVITAQDGKIYQFASVNDCYHCRTWSNKTYINTKYLDAIGASMPKTTDDFRQVLRELKEQNPSGHDDFIPFLSAEDESKDVWFVNPFTYNPGAPWLRLNDGTVEFVANTDGWRQGMALMRSLYDDGTLTKQSFSIDYTEMGKLGDRGLIGVARAGYWGSFLTIEYSDDALWYDYEPVPPLTGPDGHSVATTNHYVEPHYRFVITSACEHPETLVQWADYQMDLEAIMHGYYDTASNQGEKWDWAEEGEKGIDGRQAIWKMLPSKTQEDAPPGASWNQLSMMYRSLDFRNGQYVDPKRPNFEARLFEASQVYQDAGEPIEQQLPPLLFDEATTAEVSDLQTTLENHVNQSMAKFSTGDLDINDDAVWNSYRDKLDQMGLSQFVELHQQSYDERPE